MTASTPELLPMPDYGHPLIFGLFDTLNARSYGAAHDRRCVPSRNR
ncbi:MAG TPA: hypothetical protein VIJ31_16235 [Acidothermaceae bacterium]